MLDMNSVSISDAPKFGMTVEFVNTLVRTNLIFSHMTSIARDANTIRDHMTFMEEQYKLDARQELDKLYDRLDFLAIIGARFMTAKG